jgi:hypothetical protein
MDNLIYILAIIAWVAYAFYKNTKKVKQNIPGKSTGTGEQSTSKPDFKTLLEEMLLGEEATLAKGPAAPTASPQKQYEFGTYDDVLEKIPNQNYETYENQSLEDIVSLEVQDPERSVMYNYDEAAPKDSPVYAGEKQAEEGYREVFDLRKAVIYSAVLNRPYA